MVMMTKCPVCGGKIMDIHGPIEWDVKGEQIIVDDADYCLCASCGEIYLESGMDGDIHRRAVDQYKRDNGLLSGDEVRELRQSLGLSQAKFEKLIGAGPKTVAAHLRKRVDEPQTS